MPNYDSGPIGDHDVVSHDAWVAARLGLLPARRSSRRRATRSLGDAARCRGRRSKSRTRSTARTAAKRWPTCSPAAASSSSTTSCSTRRGRRLRAVLVLGRQLQRHRRAPEPARRRRSSPSRAPRWTKIDAFKQRMGWTFKWVSSAPSDFNFDFGVSFTPDEQARGAGVYNYVPRARAQRARRCERLLRAENGDVFHTYSTYARGIDLLNVDLQLPGPHAKGAGRSAAVGPAGMGPTP